MKNKFIFSIIATLLLVSLSSAWLGFGEDKVSFDKISLTPITEEKYNTLVEKNLVDFTVSNAICNGKTCSYTITTSNGVYPREFSQYVNKEITTKVTFHDITVNGTKYSSLTRDIKRFQLVKITGTEINDRVSKDVDKFLAEQSNRVVIKDKQTYPTASEIDLRSLRK